MTVTTGLLVRLDARPGHDAAVEAFLDSALPLVLAEPDTTAWFAVRFGRGEYGIVDVFPGEAGRRAHLEGPVAAALGERADELLATPPAIEAFEVLAAKLPAPAPAGTELTKGILMTLEAKAGQDEAMAGFLRSAEPIVADEPETVAWFAIRLDGGSYAVFDVFADNGGRLRHLAGRVPRELLKHGRELLGGFPDLDLLNVTASKLPGAVPRT